jgi:hypothetical protein
MKIVELLESGSVGADRVSRADVESTIRNVSKASGIKYEDLIPLGSTGSNASSIGDIDLAVPVSKYNPERIHERMTMAVRMFLKHKGLSLQDIEEEIEDAAKYHNGLNVGTYLFPAGESMGTKSAQVDLMYVSNTRYATFSYKSPGDKSQYKGAVRGILLSAVAASYSEPGETFIKYDEGGDLIARFAKAIDPNKGLKTVIKMRKKKKDGTLKKAMEDVTVEEFLEAFPEANITTQQATIDDPEEITEFLFGPGVAPSDIDSAEEIIALIKTKFRKKQRDLIFDIARAGFKRLRFETPQI